MKCKMIDLKEIKTEIEKILDTEINISTENNEITLTSTYFDLCFTIDTDILRISNFNQCLST